jgi:hypothetical protein
MIMKDTRCVFARTKTGPRHLNWMHAAMMVLLLAALVVVP